MLFVCDRWEVDLGRRELRAGGITVPVGSRAFDIIDVLVRSAGELVTKDDLFARVWSGTVVEENTLQVHISAVRRALGPDRGLLKTASGRGYRLLGNWTAQCAGARVAPPSFLPAPPVPPNLPPAVPELIGRDAATHYVRDLLSAYRLVTLTGPGGIGKTKLALTVARHLMPAFQGQIWVVEFGALSDASLVAPTVARVLGLPQNERNMSPVSIARAIGARMMLLVVDNCEHLIGEAAALVAAILRSCPQTSVLATSTELLRIDGEHMFRVPPLEVPATHEEALNSSAVQLFIARTKAASADFPPNGQNLAAIAAICRRLDGIPLAIEFAAARAATLGLSHVLAQLDDRFSMLTDGRRTALPRHRTLRATLDWSYDLLPATEQCQLRYLAIFAGGFTLEGAIAVMRNTGQTAATVAVGLANLVAKSLLTPEGSEIVGRWRMLETTRSYAFEKSVETGESEQAARALAAFLRDTLLATPGLQPGEDAMSANAREIDNVRAALEWAFAQENEAETGIMLTAAYVPTWLHLSLISECHDRVERALDRLDPTWNLDARLRMQLYVGFAVALQHMIGPAERTEFLLGKAVEAADGIDDLDSKLQALWALWNFNSNSGDYRLAQTAGERFLQLAKESGLQTRIAVGNQVMGNTLHHRGNHVDARPYLNSLLQPGAGEPRQVVWLQYDQNVLAKTTLARILLLEGSLDQARRMAQDCAEEAEARDQKLSLCYTLTQAAWPIAIHTGDLEAGERAMRLVCNFAQSHGLHFWKTIGECLLGETLSRRGDPSGGLALLQAGLGTLRRTRRAVHYVRLLGALAECLASVGQLAEALATVDEALARSERGGECWNDANLLRIKGELLRRSGSRSFSEIDDCFSAALAVARQQGALLFELRAAQSLAEWRISQDRRQEARLILAPVYERFEEGLVTAMLQSAKRLLDSLASSR
jgi:predicted ATPase/DNA-binding winged helix-turn-helix (wHTH) protein